MKTDPPVELFTDHLDVERKLRSGPSSGKLSELKTWGEEGHPVIDRDRWWGVDRRSLFAHEDWVFDESVLGFSACYAFAGALRTVRALAGIPDRKLSPGCLRVQSTFNGETSTNFADLTNIARLVGTSPYQFSEGSSFLFSDLPPDWLSQVVTFDKILRCRTFDDMASALLLGWVAVYNYRVGLSYEQFDQYGVAGHDYGVANHAGYADGLKKLPDGRWAADNVNSFSYRWGPSKDGRCYLDENHLFGHQEVPDVVVGMVNPLGQNPAPTSK